MWGDMFFRLLGGDYYNNEAIPKRIRKMIPHNVNLIYWDYYSTDKEHYSNQIKNHSAIKEGIWFAGGLWSWTGFAPHNGYSIAGKGSRLFRRVKYRLCRSLKKLFWIFTV